MIDTLDKECMFEEAIELFGVMQAEGIKGDRVTMVEVASTCGYLGALYLAKWTHAYIEKNKIDCDMRLGTTLVDMFTRCDDPQSEKKRCFCMDRNHWSNGHEREWETGSTTI